MRYQLRFTHEEMIKIHLLASFQKIAMDDFSGMAEMIAELVTAELDRYRQPKPAEGASK